MSDPSEASKTVLIIGAGADSLQHEGELAASLIKVARALQRCGYRTHLIDDNPFNVAPDLTAGIDDFTQAPPTVEQVTAVIERVRPVALLPTVGGRLAMQVTERLATSGILNKYQVQVLGMPVTTVRQTNNPSVLNQTLRQVGANTKKIAPVATLADAQDLAAEIGFPIVVRAVAPVAGSFRRIVHDQADLQPAVTAAIQHSGIHQAMIQQSLAGLKEIEVVVARDQSGTMMQLAVAEDLDPIGIHAGDSVTVLPAQTLLDRQIQDMRDVAFKITRKLRVVGINHVQFALDQANDRFYVIKNSPYLDRLTTFVEQATGYPLARVHGNLVAGQLLRDLRLDHGLVKHTAAMEPVLDRTAIRLPVFANEQLGIGDRPLTTEKQSVGAVIGLGRSLVEALLKALSELHLDFFALHEVADEQLDQLLIHPRANRLLAVLEALRRGYLLPELSELTRLDPFYLAQFKRLVGLERDLMQHPGDLTFLQQAKYWGMSDFLIGQIWQESAATVRQLRQDHQLHRTYKELDPSAGELDQHPAKFYSTFEQVNESQVGDRPRALVIGAGPRRLGNGVTTDYLLTRVAAELKRQGYDLVVIDNNPNSALLNRELASKCYLEPRDFERVAAVVALEQPEVIASADCSFVADFPLVRAGAATLIKLPPLALPTLKDGVTYQYNAFFDGRYAYPLGITRLTQASAGVTVDFAPDLPAGLGAALTKQGEEALTNDQPAGLYQLTAHRAAGQLVFDRLGQPPIWALAFLSRVTGLDLAAVIVRLALGKFNGRLLTAAMQGESKATRLTAVFPGPALRLQRPAQLSEMMGAALSED